MLRTKISWYCPKCGTLLPDHTPCSHCGWMFYWDTIESVPLPKDPGEYKVIMGVNRDHVD